MDDPKEGKKFYSLPTLPQLAKSKSNIKLGIYMKYYFKNGFAMMCAREQAFGVFL